MSVSNLTSSISGWFSSAFEPPSKSSEESSASVDNKPEEQAQQVQDDKTKENEENNEQKQEPEIKDNETEERSTEATSSTSVLDIDTAQMQKKIAEETQKMMSTAKSFGTYLFGVASEASKKVSTTVNETASNLKKTVEEQTIIGDLNREQKDFIQKKRERQGDGAVPPWVGYHEESLMKQQILALSSDTRNFLRSPPSGFQFQFEFQQMLPVAMATLKEDENLSKMRFRLVPTKIKEELFWRNYFYRVSLIKQSAQLSTLADLQKPSGLDAGSDSSASSIVMVGSTAAGTLSRSSSSKSLTRADPDTNNTASRIDSNLTETTDELPPAEFASDAFDPSTLNPEDLEREMRELGMDDIEGGEDIPEWEHELQKELQDYEVVNEKDNDDAWNKEIEDMLTSDPDETS